MLLQNPLAGVPTQYLVWLCNGCPLALAVGGAVLTMMPEASKKVEASVWLRCAVAFAFVLLGGTAFLASNALQKRDDADRDALKWQVTTVSSKLDRANDRLKDLQITVTAISKVVIRPTPAPASTAIAMVSPVTTFRPAVAASPNNTGGAKPRQIVSGPLRPETSTQILVQIDGQPLDPTLSALFWNQQNTAVPELRVWMLPIFYDDIAGKPGYTHDLRQFDPGIATPTANQQILNIPDNGSQKALVDSFRPNHPLPPLGVQAVYIYYVYTDQSGRVHEPTPVLFVYYPQAKGFRQVGLDIFPNWVRNVLLHDGRKSVDFDYLLKSTS